MTDATYTKRELQSVATGWQATEYIGCEMQHGEIAKGMADKINKYWAPTEAGAKSKIQQ